MTEVEKKVFEYAESVNWDYEKLDYYIAAVLRYEEFKKLEGDTPEQKASNFISKFKPQPSEIKQTSVIISIEDYNRMRALEIKQQIKKLKKELREITAD